MKIYSALLLSFVAGLTSTAWGYQLRVIVEGVENANGQVQLSLENSPESYKGSLPPLATASIHAEPGKIEYVFADLTPGTYSIKAFHDENTNNKLDLSLIGIPKESYGISNNARSAFGMPSYDDAKFAVNGDGEIRLRVKKHINF